MTILERAKKDNAKIMIKKAGIDLIKNNRDAEVNDEFIMDDEKIYYLLGTECFKKERNKDTNIMEETEVGDGVLVVTDKKIAFVDKKMIKVYTNIIWYDEILKLDFRKSFIFPDATLIVSSSLDEVRKSKNDYLKNYSYRQNNNLFRDPLNGSAELFGDILDNLVGNDNYNRKMYYNFYEFRKISKKIIKELVEFIKGIVVQSGSMNSEQLKVREHQY